MEYRLAHNIRRLRKERHLTQEQLAQAMGVTLGAVYKWESGQSVPELSLIVDMADFFSTSTDVLIGYQLRGRSLERALKELKQYRSSRQYEAGTCAVWKALQNYPNCFEIIYECGLFYADKALETQSRSDYEAALVQLDRACELIDQNTDESVSELSIRNQMARIHFCLGHTDTCMEILTQYNFCGINNARIGCILADSYHHTEQARGYLTKAMAQLLDDLDSVVIGFSTVFLGDQDNQAILSSIRWLREVLRGGEKRDHVIWFDKYECVLLAIEAEIFCMSGEKDSAKEALKAAAETAKRFDAADPDKIRSASLLRKMGAAEHHYMDYGQTALEAAERRVMTDSEVIPQLLMLWEQVKAEVL